MKLLLDTHVFLWFLEDAPSLSAAALSAIERPTNRLFFSAASYWEICIKLSIGKLKLAPRWAVVFDREMRKNDIAWLDISREHMAGIVELPMLHGDPFDRLLVSQARVEGCAIVTADNNIPLYKVETVW